MIHAGVILQCAIMGMLMRPLEPKRRPDPRKKKLEALEKANEKSLNNGRTRGVSEMSMKSDNSDVPKVSINGSTPTLAVETHTTKMPISPLAREEGNSDFMKSVTAHEVLPLIENGYVKQRKQGANNMGSAADSKLRLGSHFSVAQKEDLKRPMYRKDIFLSGSVLNLPQYRSQPNMKSYVTSVTSISGVSDERESCFDKCTCLPTPVIDTLKEMLDISLLTNFPFAMLCIGNIFGMIGFYVPFSYIVDRAVLLGIERTDAAFLLSVIGKLIERTYNVHFTEIAFLVKSISHACTQLI